MDSLIGKIVFVEQADGKSTYGNGEYIVVEQSPNNLYCMKPEAGYGGHDLRAVPMVGASKFNILRVAEDAAFVRRIAEGLIDFAKAEGKPGKQWVDSVYTGARRNGERLLALTDGGPAKEQVIHVGGRKITITIE